LKRLHHCRAVDNLLYWLAMRMWRNLIGLSFIAAFAVADGWAQTFEAVSIKPCDAAGIGGGGREGGNGVAPPQFASPGRLHFNCATVAGLIQFAYLDYANGQRHSDQHLDSLPIKGGPAWIYSDRYQLEAKAEGTPREEVMLGPMLQTLLEDRFNLKIHRETREIPVYELTVARGGLKMKAVQPGGCTLFDVSLRPPPRPEQGVNYCRLNIGRMEGRNWIVDTQAMSIDYFSKNVLMLYTDRPVVDKTGVGGLFDFRLEFAADEAAESNEPAGVSLFTAIQQQLGLKLAAAKGSGYFVVIDSVERPSENLFRRKIAV
jgi:uncharacterized protein (TIGR03435 family)